MRRLPLLLPALRRRSVLAVSTVLLATGLAAGIARAQTPGTAARFERLSLEQGLSQSSVLAALQTRDGFLWFGTQDGLNRYDGYGFRVYRHDPRDARSLSTSYVQTLAETRDGTLWVGTWGGGLNRFDRGAETFAALRHRDGDPASLPDDIVTALLETRAGALWVGTASGLCRLDAARRRCAAVYAATPGGLSHPFVWSLAEGADGALWVGTLGNGACRMEPTGPPGRFRCFRHRDGDPASLPDDGNAVVYADGRGQVWVGTAAGLARLNADARTFTVFQPGAGEGTLGGAQVNALLEDAAGRLWVGTGDGGLSRLDAGRARFVTYRNNAAVPTSLSKDIVRTLIEDRSGVLWVGTDGGGLSKYNPATERFGHYAHDPLSATSLSHNFVWTLREGAGGRVWIGTDGGGLNRFDPATGRFEHFPTRPGPAPRGGERAVGEPSGAADDVVLAVHETPSGDLWAGTYNRGLLRYDAGARRFRPYAPATRAPDLRRFIVNVIEPDERTPGGALWVGTWGGGLFHVDPARGRVEALGAHLPGARLSSDAVTALLRQGPDTLWVGTYSGGLCRVLLRTGAVTAFRSTGRPGSLTHNTVYALLRDRRGTLWVGTAGGGLNRFDARTGRFRAYTTHDGLPHNIVNGLLEDDAGGLWISTNAGLARLDARANAGRGAFRGFRTSDGLQSAEFNAGAALRTRAGEFYFGGIAGFNRFRPERITGNPHPPPVALTGFRRFDEPIPLGRAVGPEGQIVLSHADTYFAFEFAALDYVDPTRNRYAYRLEGFEDAWHLVGGDRRFAGYTNVPGGTYTFRVRAANADGVWNDEGARVRVRVVPPVWERAWFRVLAGLGLAGAFAGAGFGWHRSRLRRIERERRDALEVQRHLAESREAERLSMARELHDGPVQDLYGARFQLEALQHEISGGAHPRADAVQATLQHAIGTLRDLCKELRPPLLGSFGLAKAVRAFAGGLEAQHPGVTIRCSLDADEQALPELVRTALYRIVQEALRNVIRHAGARHVEVRLRLDAHAIRVEVEDDGCGFVVPERFVELARRDHLGLLGAAERAEAIGGTFVVESSPGRGTRVVVAVPRPSE